MAQIFQHQLWGYQLSYPDNWVHRTIGEIEGFAASPEALDEGPSFAESSHLLLRASWNGLRQPVEGLWAQHLAQTAGMIGAKNIGSAPWQLGGGSGFEAEILLPKRENRRLWAGILTYNFIVLQMALEHAREEHAQYQSVATEILKSLRFLQSVDGIREDACGFPIPPEYHPVPPRSIVPDIPEDQLWEAYNGGGSTGALQAFYLREPLARGWTMEELVPFPGRLGMGFARLRFSREGTLVTLGVMPLGEGEPTSSSPGAVVLRFGE